VRTPEANRNALAHDRQSLGLVANQWREMAESLERGATRAERAIGRTLHLVEGSDRSVQGLGKLVHLANHLEGFARGGNSFDGAAMSGRVDEYDFALPKELIAQRPLPRREDARMMVLERERGTIAHRQFRELGEFVRPDDLLVLNDTRVLPARRFSDDGAIEFLFLEQIDAQAWKCLVKPGRKMRLGATAVLDTAAGRVEKIFDEGERLVRFERAIDPYRGGHIPLPPYLNRAADAEDVTRYQTIFAKAPGAVAAPTAGLHFTPEILGTLPHTFVTLHVGTGTFRPVQSETIGGHRMHTERFRITEEAATAINSAERLLAVGTTSVRVLEAAVRRKGRLIAQEGATDIFIYPPYEFRAVDRLLTNFHLPRSTLLMLVAAFAGREFILRAYEAAARERYRFYSYGDCMLIL
jgi:S-adenosylmethionine:tRNA ribosyltransferase-isomerase